MREKNLNEKWRLTCIAPAGAERMALTGVVPGGHVHLDLLRAGRIPDPFWRDQAEACKWVEQWDWAYEREFVLSDDWFDAWVALEFGGLDTFTKITLNGQAIGNTTNMFAPYRFEVGSILKPGRNYLRVHFDSIGKHIAGKPTEHERAFGMPERIYIRRRQCTFHWDWVNRFVSCGIWKPVRLVRYDRARITDVHVQTLRIDRPGMIVADSAEVLVQVETERRTKESVYANVEIVSPSGGHAVWSVSEELPSNQATWRLCLDNPKLWWPTGYGKQPMYCCQFNLTAQDGTLLDSRKLRFGIRTVEIEQAAAVSRNTEEAQLSAIHPVVEVASDGTPGYGFIVRVNNEHILLAPQDCQEDP